MKVKMIIITILLVSMLSVIAKAEINIIYDFDFEDSNHINNWTLYGNQGQAKSDSTAQAYSGTHSMYVTGGGPTNGVYNSLMGNVTNGCVEYWIYIPTGGDYGQKMGIKTQVSTQGFLDLTGIASYWQDDTYWSWRLNGTLHDDDKSTITKDGWEKHKVCILDGGVYGYVNDSLVYANATTNYEGFPDYFVFADNFDGGSAGMYVDDIVGWEYTTYDLTTGLKAYYKVEEANSTTTLEDASDNGLDGTINNDPHLQASGKDNYAVDFSGSEWFEAPFKTFSTMNFWMRNGEVNDRVFGTDEASSSQAGNFRCYIESSGQLNCAVYDGTTARGFGTPSGGVDYRSSTWNMVTVVADGTGVYMYANGEKTALNTTLYTSSLGGESNIWNITVGRCHYTTIQYTRAEMDEIAFWDRPLNDTEISELYNSGSGKFYDTFGAEVITPSVNWDGQTPISGSIIFDSTDFYFNVTDLAPQTCTLYQDGVANESISVTQNDTQTSISYVPALTSYGVSDFYINCNDVNSTTKSITVDTEPPVIISTTPSIANTTKVDETLTLDIYIQDPTTFDTLYNISIGGVTQEYSLVQNVTTGNHTFNDVIDVSGWSPGVYTIEISGGDTA